MPDGAVMLQFGGADLCYPMVMREQTRAELRFDAPTAEAGSGVPGWLQDIVPRLQDLMILGNNWKSYGARRIKLSNLEAAVELLGRLMRPSTPTPIIVP